MNKPAANKRKAKAGPGGADDRQQTLNFFIGNDVLAELGSEAAGDNDYDAKLRRVLGDVLDGRDRERLAERLSVRLGRQLTVTHLNQWCAPSQVGRRIHADATLAICAELSDFRLLRHMAEALGYRALTEQEALCAEYGAMAVMDRQFKARQRALEGQMDETLINSLMNKLKGNAA